MGNTTSKPTASGAMKTAPDAANSNNDIKAVLLLARQCVCCGSHDPIPETLRDIPELAEILQYLLSIQAHIGALARGEVSAPIPLAGHTGDLLKTLQTNLSHVIWEAQQLTYGDFSGSTGRMGEVSEAFDNMGKALQTALSRLEQQKEDLTNLSQNLQREIDARIAVEDNLRNEQIRLQKLASTDPLTGIANRRHFFQLAQREVERIRRTGAPACLAMLDLDYFKNLNDSLGHSTGDRALHFIAQLISSSIRPYDIVGRYGGDEFIFLLPETKREDAYTLLERLRQSVEKARICSGDDTPCITVSIGLTELPTDAASGVSPLDQAILNADEALYKAKALSRNTVCAV